MPTVSLEQRLAPLAKKPAGTLLLHEIYRSVQGESMYQGLPCVFIRTAVCDLRCVWCDTPHAFTQGTVWSADEVLDKVREFDTPVVEITGGEPLVQHEIGPLMARLCDLNYKVLLETGGHRDLAAIDPRVHIIMDLKCPDSGEEAANLWSNIELLKPQDEVKFVIASERDFRWAESIMRQHRLTNRCQVIVSPAFGLVKPLEVAQWLLASGLDARLQLQLHKYVWDPMARGV
jgi:7-carboxy-7-deazaguanine synthase